MNTVHGNYGSFEKVADTPYVTVRTIPLLDIISAIKFSVIPASLVCGIPTIGIP